MPATSESWVMMSWINVDVGWPIILLKCLSTNLALTISEITVRDAVTDTVLNVKGGVTYLSAVLIVRQFRLTSLEKATK